MDYEARVIEIRDETHTVKSFLFDLNGGEINFLPGQYIDLYVETPYLHEVAGYSITSSPLDKGTISIAVKKLPWANATVYLHEVCQVGDTMALKGPGGDFYYSLDSNDDVVLIAGGIGVTPLISMCRYIYSAGLSTRVTLIYSAKNPAEMAFIEELSAMEANSHNFRCLFTVTSLADEVWTGSVGRINTDMLRTFIEPDCNDVFICGPTGMPEDVIQMLKELGVKETGIKAEMWW